MNDAPSLSASPPSAVLVEASLNASGIPVPGFPTSFIALTKSDPDTGDLAAYDTSGWTAVAAPAGSTEWTAASGGNGNWYRYVSGTVDWNAARTAALGFGGYLATVTSVAENAFIQSLKGAGTRAWLGGSDAAQQGTWTWADGPEAGQTFSIGNVVQPGFFTAWWGTEPNGSTTENVVYIDQNAAWTA